MRFTLTLPILSLFLVACAVPEETPARFGTDSVPEASVADGVSHSRSVVVAAEKAELVEWLVEVPLEAIFEPAGFLPAVTGTTLVTEDWGRPGTRRVVLLADGHQAVEELLTLNPTEGFSYRVWGFTNMAGMLATAATGRFAVTDHPDGTRITWTYTFHPRSFLTRLPLMGFVATSWSRYMTASLDNMARLIEEEFEG